MRGLTGAAIAAAAIVVVVAALYLRSGTSGHEAPPPPAPAPGARRAQPDTPNKAMERSARVEERLNELRSDFEHRQAGGSNLAASKRDVPTMAPKAQVDDSDEDDAEDPQEMAELKQTLLSNPDPDERIGAVLMLTGEEGPDSLRMLLQAMDDPDAEVRLAVVEALGDRAEELSPSTLDPAMRDPDAEVRFEAVSILGDMETPDALNRVRSALNDQDEDVRALAEGILDFADDDEDEPAPASHPGQVPPHAQQRN